MNVSNYSLLLLIYCIDINKFIIYYLFKKISLDVSNHVPNKESCVNPIVTVAFLGPII